MVLHGDVQRKNTQKILEAIPPRPAEVCVVCVHALLVVLDLFSELAVHMMQVQTNKQISNSGKITCEKYARMDMLQ